MKNNASILALLIIGIAVVLGCGDLAKQDTGKANNSTIAKAEPAKETKASPENAEPPKKAENVGGVTMANFNKIKNGMKYDEVVRILGKEGEVLSETEMSGYKTVMYKWDGDEGWGSNMNAMFQNGKLISKSQFGLK